MSIEPITLTGKCLVRVARMSNGHPALILCGTFIPNVNIEKFSINDECWLARFQVDPATIKFENKEWSGSPEDFLEHPPLPSELKANWIKKNES